MKTRTIVVTAMAASLCGTAFGGDATFTILGPGEAVDMSPDGQYVLIWDAQGAAIWTDESGIVGLGGGSAVGISNEGSTVLGQMIDPESGNNAAGLWTEATGWISLGGMPGFGGCPDLSNPYGLSGAGDVAVGLGWEGCSGVAFRWEDGTGMVALSQLGPNSARANAISNDGLVIGGWDEASNGPRRAAVWYDDGTEVLPLEGLPGNAAGLGEVWGFSTDGSIVVGQAHADLATGGAFIWKNDSVEIVPALPGTDPQFHTVTLFACSDDGLFAGGTNISGFGPFATRQATLWQDEEGVQVFADVLTANGAEIPAGLSVDWIRAMNPEGTIFVGLARQGFTSMAFRATLGGAGEPCPEDVNGDGAVGVTDLSSLILAWGACGGCAEDIDGDGSVGVTDLSSLILAWGPCP